MALTFSHTNKRITVPQAEAAPVLVQSLINAIRDEEASERGICYDQIADATGKNDLGGGVQTGITLALRSTWKIEFAAGAYQASISGGNLADALARVYNTGSPQVLVLASAAATLIETGTSGLTAEESAQLAAAAAGGGVTPTDIWTHASRTLTGITPPTADEVADAVLDRNLAAGPDTNPRSLRNSIRFLRNKWSIAGTTLSVKKEDDVTEAWSAQVTPAPGASPISGNDPA